MDVPIVSERCVVAASGGSLQSFWMISNEGSAGTATDPERHLNGLPDPRVHSGLQLCWTSTLRFARAEDPVSTRYSTARTRSSVVQARIRRFAPVEYIWGRWTLSCGEHACFATDEEEYEEILRLLNAALSQGIDG